MHVRVCACDAGLADAQQRTAMPGNSRFWVGARVVTQGAPAKDSRGSTQLGQFTRAPPKREKTNK